MAALPRPRLAPSGARPHAPARSHACHQRLPARGVAPPPPAASADDALAGLALPDIDGDLTAIHELEGAEIDPSSGVPTSFRNDTAALDALATGVAIADRSHCVRVRVAGAGARSFLHGQTTAPFADAPPGVAVNALLCTPTGRCVDAVVGAVVGGGDAVLVLASPAPPGAPSVAAALDAVAFPADGVAVVDVSADTAQFVVAGPEVAALLARLGVADAPALPANRHTMLAGGGGRAPVLVLRHRQPLGPAVDAFTLIADAAAAADVWRAAVAAGATPLGDAAWERARVTAGVPARGADLTEADASPYECGVGGWVDVGKGCFRGAEALTKVARAGKLRRQLWRLALDGPVAVGAAVRASDTGDDAGPSAGVVTSVAQNVDDAWVGLAFVSTSRAGGDLAPGLAVAVEGGVGATLVGPGGEAVFGAPAAVEAPPADAPAAASADAAADREARLAAMAARLAEWQAAQQGGGGE